MSQFYDPKGNSRERVAQSVLFEELAPPPHIQGVVHRYLELRTQQPLPGDYRFHALPDACTYAVFDRSRPGIAGVTRLRASSEELNLGPVFHYVNIRFLPGVWQRDRVPVAHGMIDSPYEGGLPLRAVGQRLGTGGLAANAPILSEFVGALLDAGIVVPNPVTDQIFQHLDDIFSVEDMADVCGISARQLQRRLKRTTGFTPHDFLKVLRLQQALRGAPSLSYADQSHFIHSFRKATGYTPGRYARKFDV